MKQTAVEWLAEEFDRIEKEFYKESTEYSDAKARAIILAEYMFKEQIMDAREDGYLSTYAEYGSTPKCYLDGGHEQYYNETFKSE